jgi:CelD/BcsL family acetyltransferase involved in cellulose biosynthesis
MHLSCITVGTWSATLCNEVASATKTASGARFTDVTPPTLDAEPACPGFVPVSTALPPAREARPPYHAERRRVADIPQPTWDSIAARTPWATPFSGWAFQRAWWDAYGANAHEETLIVCADGPGDEPIAIVPLMHRHEVEPDDALTHTTIRHGTGVPLTPVEPTATAVFFGASYHADYATILAAPADLPVVAEALADHLTDTTGRHRWDVVDLRRLRCGDPTVDALAGAFGAREMAEGWILNLEREDVCPVVTLPEGADIDGYLATLGKKERHEIRRKVHRAEAAGEVRLHDSTDPMADLEAFIKLHQKRWGELGLFPDTPGGEQSRSFARRLFELNGPDGPLRLTFLTVGERRIASGIHFETPDGYLFYNAGIDPEARDLSPGVVMVHAYVRRAIEAGKRRLDLLRGDEPYKYALGAVDEPIQRLLVRRRND